MSLFDKLNELTPYKVQLFMSGHGNCYQIIVTNGEYVVSNKVTFNKIEDLKYLSRLVLEMSHEIDRKQPYRLSPLWKVLND